MPTRFGHTAIVARDPEALAAFYVEVLDATVSGPRRDLSGPALERGMGLPGAHVQGVHLLLPGHSPDGPVLEIFSLPETVEHGAPADDVRRLGLMHLCFAVDDLHDTHARFLAAGGTPQGEIAEVEVVGVGVAEFVYLRDPEGTIVELQGWRSRV